MANETYVSFVSASKTDATDTSKNQIVNGKITLVQDSGTDGGVYYDIGDKRHSVTEKVDADLISHTSNTDNPHLVTASQVGLGNVPNVSTNNQTPTYETPSSLVGLSSGETLSTAFGKLSKSVNDLITHLSATNPHNITPQSISAATANHTHNLDNIVDGESYVRMTVAERGILNRISGFDPSQSWTVDSQLSDTSTNPVENRVVYSALDSKADINDTVILDSNGLIPSSYIDEDYVQVIPGYFYDNNMYQDSGHTMALSGVTGKLYVDLHTGDVYTYTVSSGSGTSRLRYSKVNNSLTLGTTSTTAYRGDRGNSAYQHSITTGNPHHTEIHDVGVHYGVCNSTSTWTDQQDDITYNVLNIETNSSIDDSSDFLIIVKLVDALVSRDQVVLLEIDDPDQTIRYPAYLSKRIVTSNSAYLAGAGESVLFYFDSTNHEFRSVGDNTKNLSLGNTSSTAAPGDHSHGSITNAGAISSTTALASGDFLVFSDSSDSNKLKKSSITIGSGTTTYLRNDGTWGTPQALVFNLYVTMSSDEIEGNSSGYRELYTSISNSRITTDTGIDKNTLCSEVLSAYHENKPVVCKLTITSSDGGNSLKSTYTLLPYGGATHELSTSTFNTYDESITFKLLKSPGLSEDQGHDVEVVLEMGDSSFWLSYYPHGFYNLGSCFCYGSGNRLRYDLSGYCGMIGDYNIIESTGDGYTTEHQVEYGYAFGCNNTVHSLTNTISETNRTTDSYSAVFGCANDSHGSYSFAFGDGNDPYPHQVVVGICNSPVVNQYDKFYSPVNTDTAFIVGVGKNRTNGAKNGLRITYDGTVYANGSYNSSGADFAEFFEWNDGNPYSSDRRGLFVTLLNDKLVLASSDTDYILGVISSSYAVLGNDPNEYWHDKYITDIFGEIVYEDKVVEKEYDEIEKYEEDGVVKERRVKKIKEVVMNLPKENPDYDSSKEYEPRILRKEWSPVGLCGQLVVVDDGTCEVNGYCYPGVNGVGTRSDKGYRVMKRLDETHIKVLIK